MAEAREGPTLGSLLAGTRRQFREAGLETADLDARLIVEQATGTTRSDAIARPEQMVDAAAFSAAKAAVARRLSGEPVHRILGWREFHGLKLMLSPETLEPRPDTESLVDAVMPRAREMAVRRGACRILDLGTGTGAIALALLAAEPLGTAVGTDIAPGALATAMRNAQINGLEAGFSAVRSDWFGAVDGDFHIIVSNPPYIRTMDIALLPRAVRDFDPGAALDGGPDGLDPYRIIARDSRRHLAEDGRIAVEFGFDQSHEVCRIFEAGGFTLEKLVIDLSGHSRAAIFR